MKTLQTNKLMYLIQVGPESTRKLTTLLRLAPQPRFRTRRFSHHSRMPSHILHHRKPAARVRDRYQQSSHIFHRILLPTAQWALEQHPIRPLLHKAFSHLDLACPNHKQLDRTVLAMRLAPHMPISLTMMQPFVPVCPRFYLALLRFGVHPSNKTRHQEPTFDNIMSPPPYEWCPSQSYSVPIVVKHIHHLRLANPLPTARLHLQARRLEL